MPCWYCQGTGTQQAWWPGTLGCVPRMQVCAACDGSGRLAE
jgi:DnaJ-class molecular chaperone